MGALWRTGVAWPEVVCVDVAGRRSDPLLIARRCELASDKDFLRRKNILLAEKNISCGEKYFLRKKIFLAEKYISCGEKFISCGKNMFLAEKNIFLAETNISCEKKKILAEKYFCTMLPISFRTNTHKRIRSCVFWCVHTCANCFKIVDNTTQSIIIAKISDHNWKPS